MSLWIETKIEVAIAHRQYNVPCEDKCANLHGHNLKILIEIEGEPDPITGYIIDFKEVKELIKSKFDHKTVLNQRDETMIDTLLSINQPVYELPYNPTCENISKHIWDLIKRNFVNADITTIKITVWENRDSKATYIS